MKVSRLIDSDGVVQDTSVTQQRFRFAAAGWIAAWLCLAVVGDGEFTYGQDRGIGLLLRGQDAELSERDEVSPFENHIETDRDSFTPSTRTVASGMRIVESSYSFIDNRRAAETHSFPELLLRIGLAERIELRLGGNYEVGGEGSDVSGGASGEAFGEGKLVSETQLLYGLKGHLSDQSGWLPESSVILQGHTPTSGPDPATAFTAAYVLGWELPGEWKLDSAIRFGADKEHDDRFEQWVPSIVLRKTLAERWNVHAEYFGSFSQNKEHESVRHVFSPGVHYLITPDIEIGLRVGFGLNDQTARFFSNAGIGWRF
ncbi:MAG: transporter [Pirellulaceae bacterium]|nr:transporter [Pirellulaceae bacterium]